MNDDKPRLTNRSTHLDFPFRLSDDLPPQQFSGVHTSDGPAVKVNNETLVPVCTPTGNEGPLNFLWGPIDGDNEDQSARCHCLAKTILSATLQGDYEIDKTYLTKLPRWHHTTYDFTINFYSSPLSLALRKLPKDKFLLTDKDVQTFICDFILDDASWKDSMWILHGKYLAQKKKDLEREHLGFRISWAPIAVGVIGILSLLIWLLVALIF